MNEVRSEQHALLQERIGYVEKLLGDPGGKSAKVEELRARFKEQHTNLVKCPEYSENLHEVCSEQHASFERKLDDVTKTLRGPSTYHVVEQPPTPNCVGYVAHDKFRKMESSWSVDPTH